MGKQDINMVSLACHPTYLPVRISQTPIKLAPPGPLAHLAPWSLTLQMQYHSTLNSRLTNLSLHLTKWSIRRS